MRKAFLTLGLLFSIAFTALGQDSGNRNYGSQRRKPQINSGILVVNNTGKDSYFIEANILVNVKADSYVAVFGLAQSGVTPTESNNKINQQIAQFEGNLNGLGIKQSDIYVDFITQNKVYDYTTAGNVTTEKLSGFETKKNVVIRYNNREILEKVLAVAAKNSIFDLVKIDYLVTDIKSVRAKLYDEAVKVIKQKELTYANSFGVRLQPINMANEKYDTFYPGELYASYQAYESGNTYGDYNNRVIQQRKTRTFYYEPLESSDFDIVINPLNVEPLVQFTLYLRMQYDLKK